MGRTGKALKYRALGNIHLYSEDSGAHMFLRKFVSQKNIYILCVWGGVCARTVCAAADWGFLFLLLFAILLCF